MLTLQGVKAATGRWGIEADCLYGHSKYCTRGSIATKIGKATAHKGMKIAKGGANNSYAVRIDAAGKELLANLKSFVDNLPRVDASNSQQASDRQQQWIGIVDKAGAFAQMVNDSRGQLSDVSLRKQLGDAVDAFDSKLEKLSSDNAADARVLIEGLIRSYNTAANAQMRLDSRKLGWGMFSKPPVPASVPPPTKVAAGTNEGADDEDSDNAGSQSSASNDSDYSDAESETDKSNAASDGSQNTTKYDHATSPDELAAELEILDPAAHLDGASELAEKIRGWAAQELSAIPADGANQFFNNQAIGTYAMLKQGLDKQVAIRELLTRLRLYADDIQQFAADPSEYISTTGTRIIDAIAQYKRDASTATDREQRATQWVALKEAASSWARAAVGSNQNDPRLRELQNKLNDALGSSNRTSNVYTATITALEGLLQAYREFVKQPQQPQPQPGDAAADLLATGRDLIQKFKKLNREWHEMTRQQNHSENLRKEWDELDSQARKWAGRVEASAASKNANVRSALKLPLGKLKVYTQGLHTIEKEIEAIEDTVLAYAAIEQHGDPVARILAVGDDIMERIDRLKNSLLNDPIGGSTIRITRWGDLINEAIAWAAERVQVLEPDDASALGLDKSLSTKLLDTAEQYTTISTTLLQLRRAYLTAMVEKDDTGKQQTNASEPPKQKQKDNRNISRRAKNVFAGVKTTTQLVEQILGSMLKDEGGRRSELATKGRADLEALMRKKDGSIGQGAITGLRLLERKPAEYDQALKSVLDEFEKRNQGMQSKEQLIEAVVKAMFKDPERVNRIFKDGAVNFKAAIESRNASLIGADAASLLAKLSNDPDTIDAVFKEFYNAVARSGLDQVEFQLENLEAQLISVVKDKPNEQVQSDSDLVRELTAWMEQALQAIPFEGVREELADEGMSNDGTYFKLKRALEENHHTYAELLKRFQAFANEVWSFKDVQGKDNRTGSRKFANTLKGKLKWKTDETGAKKGLINQVVQSMLKTPARRERLAGMGWKEWVRTLQTPNRDVVGQEAVSGLAQLADMGDYNKTIESVREQFDREAANIETVHAELKKTSGKQDGSKAKAEESGDKAEESEDKTEESKDKAEESKDKAVGSNEKADSKDDSKAASSKEPGYFRKHWTDFTDSRAAKAKSTLEATIKFAKSLVLDADSYASSNEFVAAMNLAARIAAAAVATENEITVARNELVKAMRALKPDNKWLRNVIDTAEEAETGYKLLKWDAAPELKTAVKHLKDLREGEFNVYDVQVEWDKHVKDALARVKARQAVCAALRDTAVGLPEIEAPVNPEQPRDSAMSALTSLQEWMDDRGLSKAAAKDVMVTGISDLLAILKGADNAPMATQDNIKKKARQVVDALKDVQQQLPNDAKDKDAVTMLKAVAAAVQLLLPAGTDNKFRALQRMMGKKPATALADEQQAEGQEEDKVDAKLQAAKDALQKEFGNAKTWFAPHYSANKKFMDALSKCQDLLDKTRSSMPADKELKEARRQLHDVMKNDLKPDDGWLQYIVQSTKDTDKGFKHLKWTKGPELEAAIERFTNLKEGRFNVLDTQILWDKTVKNAFDKVVARTTLLEALKADPLEALPTSLDDPDAKAASALMHLRAWLLKVEQQALGNDWMLNDDNRLVFEPDELCTQALSLLATLSGEETPGWIYKREALTKDNVGRLAKQLVATLADVQRQLPDASEDGLRAQLKAIQDAVRLLMTQDKLGVLDKLLGKKPASEDDKQNQKQSMWQLPGRELASTADVDRFQEMVKAAEESLKPQYGKDDKYTQAIDAAKDELTNNQLKVHELRKAEANLMSALKGLKVMPEWANMILSQAERVEEEYPQLGWVIEAGKPLATAIKTITGSASTKVLDTFQMWFDNIRPALQRLTGRQQLLERLQTMPRGADLTTLPELKQGERKDTVVRAVLERAFGALSYDAAAEQENPESLDSDPFLAAARALWLQLQPGQLPDPEKAAQQAKVLLDESKQLTEFLKGLKGQQTGGNALSTMHGGYIQHLWHKPPTELDRALQLLELIERAAKPLASRAQKEEAKEGADGQEKAKENEKEKPSEGKDKEKVQDEEAAKKAGLFARMAERLAKFTSKNSRADVPLDSVKSAAEKLAASVELEPRLMSAVAEVKRLAKDPDSSQQDVAAAVMNLTQAMVELHKTGSVDGAAQDFMKQALAQVQESMTQLRQDIGKLKLGDVASAPPLGFGFGFGQGQGQGQGTTGGLDELTGGRMLQTMLHDNNTLVQSMALAMEKLKPPPKPEAYEPVKIEAGSGQLPYYTLGDRFKDRFDVSVMKTANDKVISFTAKSVVPALKKRFLPQLDAALAQVLQRLENSKSKDEKTGAVLKEAGEKEKERIKAAARDLLRTGANISSTFYNMHLEFATDGGFLKRHKYIEEWMATVQERQAAAEEATKVNPKISPYTDYDTQLKDYKEKYLVNLNNLQKQVLQFQQAIAYRLEEAWIKLIPYVGRIDDPVDRDRLEAAMQRTRDYMQRMNTKIVSLYGTSSNNLMQIIADSKFVALYALKAVQFGCLVAAMFITEKLFQEQYMNKVYAQNQGPPSIHNMLGMLLAVHMGFMLFVVTILVLLMYIFNTTSNDFIINPRVIRAFLIDYAAFLVLFVIVAALVGQTMQVKRYFRYQTEGLRGIRAYKEIMLSLAGVLTLLPYFTLF